MQLLVIYYVVTSLYISYFYDMFPPYEIIIIVIIIIRFILLRNYCMILFLVYRSETLYCIMLYYIIYIILYHPCRAQALLLTPHSLTCQILLSAHRMHLCVSCDPK
jgi:hypothetical protein